MSEVDTGAAVSFPLSCLVLPRLILYCIALLVADVRMQIGLNELKC